MFLYFTEHAYLRGNIIFNLNAKIEKKTKTENKG